LVFVGMLLLPLLVAGVIAAAIVWTAEPARRTRRLIVTDLIATLWLALPAALALRGVLASFEQKPPPFMWLTVSLLIATIVLAWSKIGGELSQKVPLWVLVGAQGFRLPLELVMHQAAVEGLMPVQMSYSGHNFDIVTGCTAIVLAFLIATDRAPRALVMAWNVMGSLLLLTIVTIAIASTPMFAAYGPHQLNTWVTRVPYVWLPAVLVCAALLGHLLVFRRLATTTR
jgi:hypothetical protein